MGGGRSPHSSGGGELEAELVVSLASARAERITGRVGLDFKLG